MGYRLESNSSTSTFLTESNIRQHRISIDIPKWQNNSKGDALQKVQISKWQVCFGVLLIFVALEVAAGILILLIHSIKSSDEQSFVQGKLSNAFEQLSLLNVGQASILKGQPNDTNALKVKKICLSQSCVAHAAHLLKSMNPNVNPCDDFYQYACGGWIKNNPIPDERANFDIVTKLNEEHTYLLRGNSFSYHIKF